MSKFKKIIFVTPWYGKDATGGAELQCRTLAENLKNARFNIEIYTSCSKQFHSSWINDFKPEKYYENGLLVKRFKVDKRDSDLFNSLNSTILSNSPHLNEDEELAYFKNSINSKDMMNEIKNDSESLFIFIPYLYGTTFFGCQIHPERSIMIPCLHDENYAKMSLMKRAISQVRAISFNSASEKDFVGSLLEKLPHNSILGEGIDIPNKTTDPISFKKKYNLKEFILYAGRKENGKNTPLLVKYFTKFLENNNTDLKLVLTGKGDVSIPDQYSKNILNIYLSSEELHDAYSAATLFCLPSIHESFSRVIMESWLHKTPVLVNADSLVTKDFCLKSDGGLYFTNYDEFEECIKYYLENPEIRKKLGENGQNYVSTNFNWNKIISVYTEFFNSI
ncbi:MAG: glycosyltransferase family 4 protein [Nitrosopumilaceae archaeon]